MIGYLRVIDNNAMSLSKYVNQIARKEILFALNHYQQVMLLFRDYFSING